MQSKRGLPGWFDSVAQWWAQDSVSSRLSALRPQNFSFRAKSRRCLRRARMLFSRSSVSLCLPLIKQHWPIHSKPISELVPGAREWGAWLELARHRLFYSKGAVRGRCGCPCENGGFLPKEAVNAGRGLGIHRVHFRGGWVSFLVLTLCDSGWMKS